MAVSTRLGKVREKTNRVCVWVCGWVCGWVWVWVWVCWEGGEMRCGYNLGMSSRMEAILKNQLRQVSLPDSGTWSDVKFSVTMTTKKKANIKIII